MPAVNQEQVSTMTIVRIDDNSNYEIFSRTPRSVVQRIESAKETIQELSDKWTALAGDSDARIEYNYRDATTNRTVFPSGENNQVAASEVTLPDVAAIIAALDSALTTAQALEVTFPDV